MKPKLKGRTFDDIDTLQTNVMEELKGIPKEDNDHTLKRLAERAQTCIDLIE